MRRFTLRDLTISLGDSGSDSIDAEGDLEASAAQAGCPFHSCGWTIVLDPPCGSSVACGGCTLQVSNCGPVTNCGRTACHPAVTNTSILKSYNGDDLGLLQEELERELRAIETHMGSPSLGTAPLTVEEIEELEEKLTAVLGELQQRKSESERG